MPKCRRPRNGFNPPVRHGVAPAGADCSWRAAAGRTRELAEVDRTDTLLEEYTAALDVPTPLLVGENSSEHMASASRHLSQEIVGAEGVTLSAQEHIAYVLDPVSLAEIIKDFLSR